MGSSQIKITNLSLHSPKFRYAGATIMSVVYGLDISDTSDRYLEVAEKSISQIAQAGVPGTFLVDMLPWCKSFQESLI